MEELKQALVILSIFAVTLGVGYAIGATSTIRKAQRRFLTTFGTWREFKDEQVWGIWSCLQGNPHLIEDAIRLQRSRIRTADELNRVFSSDKHDVDDKIVRLLDE